MLGGYSGGARDEVLAYNGSWAMVGRMNTKKYKAAAVRMFINTAGPLDITGCS